MDGQAKAFGIGKLENQSEESDNTDLLASHRNRWTGLTLTPRAATVTTVADSQASPLGTKSGLVTDHTPSSVAAGGGVFIAHWWV